MTGRDNQTMATTSIAASVTTTTTMGLSNAASVVGRHIRFLDTKGGRSSQSAVITSYQPENNTHTVEFQDGTQKDNVVLNKHRFKFLVSKCEPSNNSGTKARMLLAAQRDAVGRPIKVFSPKRNEYMHGTITAFNEETGKHDVTLKNKNKTVHHLDLQSEKVKWRYTDVVNRQAGKHSITTSKYTGVQRRSESRWMAYNRSARVEAGRNGYIGNFTSEKDAALAHDYYARKHKHSTVLNFPNEHLSKDEIEKRRSQNHDFSGGAPTRGHGKSKYRGVHWQKNRKRWMARYSLAHKGEKNINIGAFETAEYAAMAFDFEARKRGRPERDLNFPEQHPTEAQIEQWKTNTAHYTMMRSGSKRSSQYRGVTWNKQEKVWHAQCNITKVVRGMGKQKGPVRVGNSKHEEEAALAFDRACRKFGVPEKELNFPRNHQLLNEVRLFDDECYFCYQTNPTDPVATPCNHVFCRACILSWLEQKSSCPCCKMPDLKIDALRSVTLVPWPEIPDPNTTTTRKRKHVAAVAAAANSADCDSSDSDIDDNQISPSDSDSDHDGENEHEPAVVDETQKRRTRRQTKASSASNPPITSPVRKKTQHIRRRQGKYPVGTRFVKEFKGHGKFEGRVVDFDGTHYQVYYPKDGDEETLSEDELDKVEILGDNNTSADAVTKEDCDSWHSSSSDQEESPSEQVSSSDDDDTSSIDSVQPRFPIGTRFIKEFPGYGRFEGHVVDFDGECYEVHYSQDGDEEVIHETDLEKLEILDASKTGQSKKKAARKTR